MTPWRRHIQRYTNVKVIEARLIYEKVSEPIHSPNEGSPDSLGGMFSYVPNNRTVPNKRSGWTFSPYKIIVQGYNPPNKHTGKDDLQFYGIFMPKLM